MYRAFAVICLILMVTPAHAANSACSTRDQVISQLNEKYKEAPTAVGLANNGALVEVLTTGDGSTWTLVVSMPNGATCLLAAGQDWQVLVTTPPDPRGGI